MVEIVGDFDFLRGRGRRKKSGDGVDMEEFFISILFLRLLLDVILSGELNLYRKMTKSLHTTKPDIW